MSIWTITTRCQTPLPAPSCFSGNSLSHSIHTAHIMPLDLHSMRQLVRPIIEIDSRTLKCRLPLRLNSTVTGIWTVTTGRGTQYIWQSDHVKSTPLSANLKECHPSLKNIISIPIETLRSNIERWQREKDELARISQKPDFKRWALCEGFNKQGFLILASILKKDQQSINLAGALLKWRKKAKL